MSARPPPPSPQPTPREEGFPPAAEYLWEIISPLNFDYTESETHVATMYRHRERDPCPPNHLWACHRWKKEQTDGRKPTPKYTWTTGIFESQTDIDALMGFQQHPKPDSLGKVLRSKDVVIWIITGLKDFDDVDGHVTPFPCEDEDDTVWLEIPRPLWAKGPYPKHYDEKQGGDIFIKVPLEDVDQRASEVRSIYRTKAAETCAGPAIPSNEIYLPHCW